MKRSLAALNQTNILGIRLPNSKSDYFSSFIDAIKKKNFYFVKKVLDSNLIDPSQQNDLAIRVALKHKSFQAIEYLLSDSRVNPCFNKNSLLNQVCRLGDLNLLELLLNDSRIDPSVDDCYAFVIAAKFRNFFILSRLLQDSRIDPSAGKNIAIKSCAEHGRFELVQQLLKDPRVNPSADNDHALRYSVVNLHFDIVELLIKDPRVNPGVDSNNAFRVASTQGKTGIVQYLIDHPKVDPFSNRNNAYNMAKNKGYLDIAKIIYNNLLSDGSPTEFPEKVMRQLDITMELKDCISKELDPIMNPFVSSSKFNLYDSVSAIQIDKENMDNFMNCTDNDQNLVINYNFPSISKFYKFISEILVGIFQHLIKATSLSTTLFACKLVKPLQGHAFLILGARIVNGGSLLQTINRNFLLYEDYFLESIDTGFEYYDWLSMDDIEQIIDSEFLNLTSKWPKDAANLRIIIGFFNKLYEIMGLLKCNEYKSSISLLEILGQDLEKLKVILENQDEKESFFDVELNRHLYVQVQTKPLEFMSFDQCVNELRSVFKEWKWILERVMINFKSIELWELVYDFVDCFPNSTTLGRSVLINSIFHSNKRILGEFTEIDLFGHFIWSFHGNSSLLNLVLSQNESKNRFFQIQEVWIKCIQVMFYNPCRRHRKFYNVIKEWDLEEKMCSPLDNVLLLSEYGNPEINMVGSVMFDFKLRLLIYYLMIGFQLYIYSDIELCAVCFNLIYIFKRRQEFLAKLQSLKKKQVDGLSIESLSISSTGIDFNLEILKCKASELFFHGLAYFIAFLYQKDYIRFPNNRIFSYTHQYRYRFKIFEDLNNLAYQDFDLFSDFWENLLKNDNTKDASNSLFQESLACATKLTKNIKSQEFKNLVSACELNLTALDDPESALKLNDGRYFRISNGLFPHT